LSRIDVHDYSPISVDCDIIVGFREFIIRPLSDITPESNKVFLNKHSRRSRAQIPADYGINVNILKFGFVSSTDTNMELSIVIVVDVVILPIIAS
jgi:hypothetical protein